MRITIERNNFFYSQSKWVAETIISIARERGVPTVIYRPGDISGDSNTGVSNKSDFIVKIICGLIHLQHYPSSDVYFEMTPVDFISKAIGKKKTNCCHDN